jgi:hypothetical protein
MEAKAKDLMFLGQVQRLEIPFFQRSYVWTKENWEELLRDLSDLGRSHFLGALIFKWESHTVGDQSSALVIDGQQRLTTLSLLLKALYDTLPDSLKDDAKHHMLTALFYKERPLDRQYKVKIQHSRLDRQAYEAIIRQGILDNDGARTLDNDSLITKAYEYFTSELSQRSVAENEGLLNHLLNPNSKILVLITLDLHDEEQKIFDTINSAGVRLSSADIIKNALFQKVIAMSGRPDAIALYESTWGLAFSADDESRAFWDAEKVTGRLRRDNLEIFLHAVAVIGGYFDPELHTMQDLASCFKQHIQKLTSSEDLANFANQLTTYSKKYREYFGDVDSKTALTFDDGAKRLLHILDNYQISALHPYVLYVLADRPSTATNDLQKLERFIVRRIIAGRETKSLNKLVRDFVQRPERVVAKAMEISDSDIAESLQSISNKDARIILFWMELYRRANDSKYDEAGLVYNYTLEHIMPQKWEREWPLSAEELAAAAGDAQAAAKRRATLIYSLGNMTLLNARLNPALSNMSFARKILGDGRKKGMQSYGTLSITLDDVVRPYLEQKLGWDEARITARTKKLQSEFLAIWPAEVGSGSQDQPASS